MCLCCVGWFVFATQGTEPCATRACVYSALRILGLQLVVAPLDYLFWTLLIGLSGAIVFAIVAFLDIAPAIAQAVFVVRLARRCSLEERGERTTAPSCQPEQLKKAPDGAWQELKH